MVTSRRLGGDSLAQLDKDIAIIFRAKVKHIPDLVLDRQHNNVHPVSIICREHKKIDRQIAFTFYTCKISCVMFCSLYHTYIHAITRMTPQRSPLEASKVFRLMCILPRLLITNHSHFFHVRPRTVNPLTSLCHVSYLMIGLIEAVAGRVPFKFGATCRRQRAQGWIRRYQLMHR